MGKLRLGTSLGLSGYACYVKTKDTMLFFTLKNMANTPNALEMSQIIFLWSTQKKWEKINGKTCLKKTFGLSDYAC